MVIHTPYSAAPIANLVEELSKLPGIGPKTAQRLAFYLVRGSDDHARALAEAIVAVKERVVMCSRCFNITEADPCAICTDSERDQTTVCVVEEALDLMALERTRSYHGLYHVLHGAVSPMNGVGPDDLRIRPLLKRLETEPIREVILATNPNLEGDATAMYIHQRIASDEVSVTRPARGLPVGGDIEYADESTLGRAIEGRQSF